MIHGYCEQQPHLLRLRTVQSEFIQLINFKWAMILRLPGRYEKDSNYSHHNPEHSHLLSLCRNNWHQPALKMFSREKQL